MGRRPSALRNAKSARDAAVPPPSARILWANTRAASSNVGSFSPANACNGVFVRGRRATHASRLGASNVANVGYVHTRLQNVYMPRRYRSGPSLKGHSSMPISGRRNPISFHRLATWTGCTLGPPTLGLSNPLTANAWSRTISPSMRNRGPRDRSRL